PKAATDPPSRSDHRNYDNETPVSEEMFNTFRRLYSYDKTPLNGVIESIDENDPRWRKDRVTFDAAYGNERMIAYLFLPKHIAAPYQTVIYFPGSYMFVLRSDHNLDWEPDFNFILKSGRAVIYPIYKGTYERGDGLEKSDYPDATIF